MSEETLKTPLPDKPSELIELALSDLEKVERDPRYKVDMDTWHQPGEEFCHVCFAGAVMAMSCGTEPQANSFGAAREYGQEAENKFEALDSFRRGNVVDALDLLGCETSEATPWDRTVTQYWESPLQFKSEMRKLATELREDGL